MSSSSDQYEWLSARDGVLRRPEIHVGSVHPRRVERTVLDETGSVRAVSADVSPALEKVFDEVVTNALDHAVRDAGMTELRITISEDGSLSVFNNAKTSCIPTGKWDGTDRHVPEVLFVELNSGSNLGDANAHNVGGRNGVGASVTNILSTRFCVSIHNAADKVWYLQRTENNCGVVHPPQLKAYKEKTSKVCITFTPDYARLHMPNGMDEGVRSLLVGRAVDASACTRVSVYVNEAKLPYGGPGKTLLTSFRGYASAFGGSEVGYETTDAFLSSEAGVAVVATTRTPPVHACFVNGVRCTGTLYSAILCNLCSSLSASSLSSKTVQSILCDHVSVFVTARMNTPSWGGQTKDVLDTPASKFGFDVSGVGSKLSSKLKTLDAVKDAVEARKNLEEGKAVKKTLKETGGKRTKTIKKFERATEAGKRRQCTLWLSEGDSAKAMIVSGFSVTGREYHGVYPLRGKLRNVYDLSASEALKNAEISEMISILHLDPSKTYDVESVRRLPYNVMVTTDQDDDGSHIFGLVMAVFYRFFPTVLSSCPGFVKRFVTPVVKVWPTPSSDPHEFFALATYRAWEKERSRTDARKPSSVAYYKGLGTNTDEEAAAYFSRMDRYVKTCVHTDACGEAMRVCFSDSAIAERKEVLAGKDPHGTHSLYDADQFTVREFCAEELPLFWQADNLRSIPSVLDGLKPSQRKTVFTVLRSSAKHKVAQLAADVAKATNYHHGEAAMADVIVKMAQTFFGSNNLPLLVPKGLFGNRHGEKASQPRYIFTMRQPYLSSLFHPDDGPVLEHLVEEGMQVEPKRYVPVVPLLLVNGAQGIGTGYSTSIPPHSLSDVMDRCRRICDGDDLLPPLVPHVRGFKGTVEETRTGWDFVGAYEWTGDASVRVTELPPGTRTNQVKADLAEAASVEDVESHSTGDDVDLRVLFRADAKETRDVPTLFKTLKLKSSVSRTNMYAFDADGKLTRYETAIDILRAHAKVRLSMYEARKQSLLREAERERDALDEKLRFVTSVVRGEVKVFGERRATLKERLGPSAGELLKIDIDKFSLDGVAEFEAKRDAREEEMRRLQGMTAEAWWKADLDALEEEVRRVEEEATEKAAGKRAAAADAQEKKKKKTKKKATA